MARRDFAAEMLKLREASGLLNASAKVKHGKIEFDLGEYPGLSTGLRVGADIVRLRLAIGICGGMGLFGV